MSDVVDALIEFIRAETGFTGPIAADEDLIHAGALDSFSVVSLAVFAQQRFGIELSEEELVRENLARLNRLAHLIEQRRADRA